MRTLPYVLRYLALFALSVLVLHTAPFAIAAFKAGSIPWGGIVEILGRNMLSLPMTMGAFLITSATIAADCGGRGVSLVEFLKTLLSVLAIGFVTTTWFIKGPIDAWLSGYAVIDFPLLLTAITLPMASLLYLFARKGLLRG